MIGRTLGRFKITGRLGAGGMGEVYRARDEQLGREVAVKVIAEKMSEDPKALARFEREAKAVAALNHPNILSIHDYGHEGDLTYAVMELLEGETLQQRLEQGSLPVSKAVEIAGQICAGLAAAHEKGIVHRDLKPGNIFLTQGGQVKILDFGLARVEEPSLPEEASLSDGPTIEEHTHPGMVMGTIGYMSPEQARGHPADARSDIFALGVVLYEMLSGRKAFQGGTASDTLAAILTKDPPPLPPVTPPGLDRIVRQCLEKRPEDRISSAHDAALALQAVSTSGGAVAAAPGGRQRARWWMAAAALLLALSAAGLWHWKGRPVPPAAAPGTHAVKSIAVFPLDDLSGDAAQSFFAPTMTDALNIKLTQIKSLRVIGQVSAAKCKKEDMPLSKVAEVLGVDAVVQGTVVRVGDTVRISVRLLDARTDSNLWAESYERKLSDVLVLQGEVAQAIAASMSAVISPVERARLAGREVDPRAYDEYLSARTQLRAAIGPQSYIQAIAHLRKTIELAPHFALAHAWLSACYQAQWEGSYVPYAAAHPLARAAALKAVEVGPSEAATHARLANFLFDMERDLEGAERESRLALELDDKDQRALACLASILTITGHAEEAIQLRRHAVDLDPQNLLAWYGLSVSYTFVERWSDAIRSQEKAMELGSTGSRPQAYMGLLYAFKGDRAKALAYAEEAKTLPGWKNQYPAVGNLAITYAILGMRPETEEMLRIRTPLCIGNAMEEIDLGIVYAWLGETDRAFGQLEKAAVLPGSPAFEIAIPSNYPKVFTRDPRYSVLVQRIGLPKPKVD